MTLYDHKTGRPGRFEYNAPNIPLKADAQGEVTLRERFDGSLLGCACCDALGTAQEFVPRSAIIPIDGMVDGGPHRLLAGHWSDDTSMALCMADSLLENGDFVPKDHVKRYRRWYKTGYRSSTGFCFDIGATIRQAILFNAKKDPEYPGCTGERSAGNGSIMRLCTVPMFFYDNFSKAIEISGLSSQTTHKARAMNICLEHISKRNILTSQHPECIDACKYMAGIILGALAGETKEKLLSPFYTPPGVPDNYWEERPLVPATAMQPAVCYRYLLGDLIADIASCSYKTKSVDEIKTTGYVVHTLEAALWTLYVTSDLKTGALKSRLLVCVWVQVLHCSGLSHSHVVAGPRPDQQCFFTQSLGSLRILNPQLVNLGGDADTTGAVYGQIAGAHYGMRAIPREWRELCAQRCARRQFAVSFGRICGQAYCSVVCHLTVESRREELLRVSGELYKHATAAKTSTCYPIL